MPSGRGPEVEIERLRRTGQGEDERERRPSGEAVDEALRLQEAHGSAPPDSVTVAPDIRKLRFESSQLS